MAPLYSDLESLNNNTTLTVIGSIPDWYSKKNVFITGATGLLGKVLVERLLQTCPDIGLIYILIRTKKGLDPAKRFEKYTSEACFEKLRDQNSAAFEKLRLVSGDMLDEGLGLSSNDREELIQNVNVVFHCAATVKFTLPLKEALNFNLLGTHKLLDLAVAMKDLASFVHVSTAYSQNIGVHLEEKAYDPGKYDALEILDMAKLLDTELMEMIKSKLMDPAQSNTYTYSKCLAENLVSKYAGRIPVSIARPAIITGAQLYPMPGYTELYAGANGISLAGAHGLIRAMYVREEAKIAYVPVDYVAHACIAIARNRAQTTSQMPVYNIVDTDNSCTWRYIIEMGKDELINYTPFAKTLWCPNSVLCYPYILYKFYSLFLHYVPALFIDALLVIFFRKPVMFKVYRKLDKGIDEYRKFTEHRWTFQNKHLQILFYSLTEKDRETFDFTVWKIDWNAYVRLYIQGLRKYVAKDPPETIPRARRQMKILWALDRITRLAIYGYGIYLLYGLLTHFTNHLPSLEESLKFNKEANL